MFHSRAGMRQALEYLIHSVCVYLIDSVCVCVYVCVSSLACAQLEYFHYQLVQHVLGSSTLDGNKTVYVFDIKSCPAVFMT